MAATKKKILEKLKPKAEHKPKPPSLPFWFFIGIIVILTLNFALLLPGQLNALWFQVQLIILQHLNYPVYLHRWELYVIIIGAAAVGYWFFPTVYVPHDKKVFWYLWTWTEGDLRYFRTWSGFYMAVHKTWVRKRGNRFTVIAPVHVVYSGNYILLQTANLEVSKAIFWKNLALDLMEKLANVEDMIRNRDPSLTFEQVLEVLEKSIGRWGGGQP